MGRDSTMVYSHLLSEFMALEPDLGFKSQHFLFILWWSSWEVWPYFLNATSDVRHHKVCFKPRVTYSTLWCLYWSFRLIQTQSWLSSWQPMIWPPHTLCSHNRNLRFPVDVRVCVYNSQIRVSVTPEVIISLIHLASCWAR